ncbi:MAG: hypothetical protein AAFZ15_32995 [Bacteroidota bacterium]
MKIKSLIKTAVLFTVIVLFGMKSLDGGDCVRIYGEFKLSDGEIVKGYAHTDRLDFESAENDLKRFLHYSYRDVKAIDSITIFERIDTLSAIGIKDYRQHCDFFFLASPIEKVRVIGYDDWEGGKLKNEYPCETCNQKEYLYASGGYSPAIITELDKYEIEILKQAARLNSFKTNYGELTTIHMVSLTGEYSQESLEKLYKEISINLDYPKLKMKLKELGIATFRIHWQA